MGYNEHFSKAVYSRKVTGSMLVDYMKQIKGKTEEEIQILLEKFANEIEETCPYEDGKDPSQNGFSL